MKFSASQSKRAVVNGAALAFVPGIFLDATFFGPSKKRAKHSDALSPLSNRAFGGMGIAIGCSLTLLLSFGSARLALSVTTAL